MAIEKIMSVEPCDNCGEVIKIKYRIGLRNHKAREHMILCEKCAEELYVKLFEALVDEEISAA